MPTFTLAFVGDVMLGRGVAQALDGDWEAAFSEVEPWLAGADLAFANLESPLTAVPFSPPSPVWGRTEDGRYDLRAPRDAVAALQAAGFDVVSVANNHALDGGRAGMAQTLVALEAAGLTGLVGWETGRSVDWSSSPVFQSAHVPVCCFLAFDDSAASLDLDAAARVVADAAGRAGVVVVSIHWGGEYQAAPSPRQRAIAARLAGAGADVVAGHGPHVLQPVEWVGETLVAYSLGNFLFDQPYPVDCRWGTILHITLREDRIVSVDPIPTVSYWGRVKLAGPDDGSAIFARLNLEPET